MSMNRKRKYALVWRRYQRRSDVLTRGTEDWFLGKEYFGQAKAYWVVLRHHLVSKGVPSKELTPWRERR